MEKKRSEKRQNEGKAVTVMIGQYPYQTIQSDIPKVCQMAENAVQYFLSKGVPQEKVDKLYKITLPEETEEE